MGGLSQYEQERQEKIRINNDMLKSLGISDIINESNNFTKPKKATTTKKGISIVKRKASVSDVPTRKSRRLEGAEVDLSGRVSKKTDIYEAVLHEKKIKTGKISLEASNTKNEKELYNYLKSTLAGMREKVEKPKLTNSKATEQCIKHFRLLEDDVCKMSKERIMHTTFHPANHKRIVLTGNKIGEVALWDVDRPYSPDQDYLTTMIYELHNKPLSAVIVNPFKHHQLYSSAYDGTAACTDLETKMVNYYYSDSDNNFTSSAVSKVQPNVTYLCDNDGSMLVFDLRMSNRTQSNYKEFQLHDRKIGEVDSHPFLDVIVTSSLDRTCCLWDLRTMSKKMKPIKIFNHDRAVSSASFSPSGNSVVTTGNDDKIKIWKNIFENDNKKDFKINKTVDCEVIKHNNQTGRWITNFKAKFLDDNYIQVGNMRRFVDVYSTNGVLERQLDSEFMTAIPAVNDYHQEFMQLAASTNGKCHIFKYE